MLKKFWSSFVKGVARTAGLVQQRAHHFYPGALGKNSLVIDLGAHKGEFSRFISLKYGCSVLGLEANPHLYAVLPALPGVRFLHLAINRDDSPVVFHLSQNPEASSVIEEVAQSTGRLTRVIVPGITLDSLLQRNEWASVDLLKVDIESAEFQMLETAREETLSKITQITVEFHVRSGAQEYSVESVTAIMRRLRRLGFRTFAMDRNYTDVLFLNTRRISWIPTERLAMTVFRFFIVPVRAAIAKSKPQA